MSEWRRREYSGFRALMVVLCTPPSARSFRYLFPKSRSKALTSMVLDMVPNSGTIRAFALWHDGFIRRRFSRPKAGRYAPRKPPLTRASTFFSKRLSRAAARRA
jgi:hypothetical protein